jgi:segregation and condensation protein A
MSYEVALDRYQGPIELLLYLIRQDELDIMEIPIARITDEYLDHLRRLKNLDLKEAADFVLVAAILVRLKLLALLPGKEAAVELPETKIGLSEILARFGQYKAAANILAQLGERQQMRFPRGNTEPEDSYGDYGDLYALITAFQEVMHRKVQTQVELPRVEFCITDYIDSIRGKLARNRRLNFQKFLMGARNLAEVILYFLATLELCRLGELSIRQDREFGAIYLCAR